MPRFWRVRVYRWGLLASLLAVSGCLARLEHNIDLVFAPEATQNLLRLPLSPLLPLARLFSVLLGG